MPPIEMPNDLALLLCLDEVARRLGGVSKSTVRRLMSRGDLFPSGVRTPVCWPAESAIRYVAAMPDQAPNLSRVGSVAWKESQPCHTDARTHHSGGSNSPTQAASQLTALLAQLIEAKPRHLKRNGD